MLIGNLCLSEAARQWRNDAVNLLQPAALILAIGFAFTPALCAQLKLSAPVPTASNRLQLSLSGASANAAYVIAQATNQLNWTPVATGAVGQVTFTLPRPGSAAVFFRASQIALPPAIGLMNSADVTTVIAQALTRAAQLSTTATVAVVDREGFVLGVWSLQGPAAPPLDVIDAITKAGTAAFLSSDQEAFTSRTAGFIVQQHFPPGIENKPTGPLVGVNFSNLSFTDVNRFKDPHTWSALAFGGGGTNGAPVTLLDLSAISGLAGSPGGVPLYKNGHLIGGVGVVLTGRPAIPALDDIQLQASQTYDVDEDAALAGQIGFAPSATIFGSGVLIDGIRVPYVASSTSLGAVAPLTNGAFVPPYAITDSPPVNYPILTNFGGISNLMGEMRAPIISDPLGCADCLTATEVTNILALSAQRAAITRAGIRLPAGQPAQVFITVVNNPGSNGAAPAILGTWRTPEATIFSWDVAAQKARTALYFSRSNSIFGTNSAVSSRTVGFLSQAMYPPGIANTAPGPWLGLQEKFSLIPPGVTNPLNGVVFAPATPPTPPVVDPTLPNGLTIFPGGFPLYRGSKLIGAIGVSGDGIDQDDLIAASGTVNFLPPPAMRADQFIFRGTRLPYAKFPRNPSL